MQKQCTKCKEFKNVSEFCKNKTTPDGLCYWCKDCINKNYRNKREEILKQQREYRKTDNALTLKKIKDFNYRKRNYELKKQRERNSIKLQLSNQARGAIYKAIRFHSKFIEQLLGYTENQLKEHLENQFTSEMTWDNYGSYWEIDHIIPINVFNYQAVSDKEFKICWSLLNLRPLLCKENRERDRRKNIEEYNDISLNLMYKILHQFD